MRIAIVSTHPIQYHTPWFRELGRQNIELKVYYALLPDQQQQAVGFGEAFAWDIPLLEGYDWELLPNKRESPALTGFFRSSTPAIYSRLADSKPDVVIITGWQSLPLLQALWAAFRLGIPCIVRGESNGLRQRPLLVQALHRLLLSRFNAFLAIGKLNRQFYLDYGIPAERIFSAPYFVDNQRFIDQFRQDVRERGALRAGWNIDGGRGEDGETGRRGEGETGTHRDRSSVARRPSSVAPRTCFLFAGKLEPKKRIIDLLRAVDLARETEERRMTDDGRPPLAGRPSSVPGRPSIHLLVVGTGELMEEARQFAESRGLAVTFAGFLNQTEITRAYAVADCLVLPSDYGETWGLVVNEAMACGLPAIVSDRVGSAPDLVEEGVTGGVFPCGDINALAQKLQAFASDPAKLARMGEQAKQRINGYSVGNAVAGTMRALEFVTSDGRRATGDSGKGELKWGSQY
ncbi:MAG TPA: glycosyltransferase [Blastocatellia bacterium]|nr:glycosyltransferase [Blastocatellia bacterium]